ncbi:MAG: Gfo/Idh/MocA family protein [Planctomycetales bacterium]
MTDSNDGGQIKITRRECLGSFAIPIFIPDSVFGNSQTTSPNERISVGVVGAGSRGFNLIDEFLKQPDAQIVAVCDVDSFHHRDRPWGKGPAYGRTPAKRKIDAHYKSTSGGGISVTSDFREICQRDDIDAVVVATPDHWHALCTLEALRNGKDVYCEKPVTHTFHEGQLVYREVSKQKAVFQTGSQQRSSPEFRRAVQLVRAGILGTIQRIEVGLPPGYDKPQGDTTIVKPPDHLDYDQWCGPAPKLPYMRARHHRWWRGHRAYGGGVLMDWIGHHNDIAHWAIDADKSGLTKVEAVGWTFPDTDVYDTPHQYDIRCEYAGGIQTSISSRNLLGTKFIGENGWVHVTRGRLTVSDKRWADSGFQVATPDVYVSENHTRNFLDCVMSRKECIAPAETGHRSITPGHLAYVSDVLGRALKWDAANEVVIKDPEANKLLQTHNYRKPWKSVA